MISFLETSSAKAWSFLGLNKVSTFFRPFDFDWSYLDLKKSTAGQLLNRLKEKDLIPYSTSVFVAVVVFYIGSAAIRYYIEPLNLYSENEPPKGFRENTSEKLKKRLSDLGIDQPSYKRIEKTPRLKRGCDTKYTKAINDKVFGSECKDGPENGYSSAREYRRSVGVPRSKCERLRKAFKTFKEIEEANLFNVLNEERSTFDYVTPVVSASASEVEKSTFDPEDPS